MTGEERSQQKRQEEVPLRKQTALDQAEGKNMQGHLFCPAVLGQHFNGDIWSLGQKPEAEVASWDN